MVSLSEPKMRVNGATLAQQNGRPVILLGNVRKIEPSGVKVQVEGSDGAMIVVKLQNSLEENLEGLVEFHGKSEGSQMAAEFYIDFPDEYAAKFDMGLYDQAIKLIHSIGTNPWKAD